MVNEKRLIDANALEFEPDENCIANGVLIWGSRTGGKTMTTVLHALKAMVDNAPTVDAVEVVHGRWIHDCVEGCNPFVDSLTVWVDVMQCSVCKEYIEGSHGTNYCPNCGAKMDGDGNV